MDEKNNGGSAFPDFKQTGMSLRDYFAAKFADAIHRSTMYSITAPDTGRHCYTQPAAQTAQQAYELADAMIAERAK